MDHKEIKQDRIAVQKDLVALARIFGNAGFSVYLVGGALRDMYLNRENYDLDVATDARPEDVVRLFRKTIPTGIKHGTVTIRFKGHSIECTTMRREAGYSDSRHPDSVEYGTSITEDLSRRDFGMNAIAARLPEGNIIDPYNGRKDIEEKTIRAVGEPLMRFSEDGLRPMRAIRFASQLGFCIEKETLQAIPLSLEKMKSVSIERFQDEFNKMLKGEYFPTALLLMKKTGIMQLFLPKLNELEELQLYQMLYATSLVPSKALTLRLSLICYWIHSQEKSGNLHSIETMLKALKYSNKMIEDVLHFVKHCNFEIEMLTNVANYKANIRRFLKKIGKENVQSIFTLKKAITLSKIAKDENLLIQNTFSSSETQCPSYNRQQKRMTELFENIEQDIQTVLEENPALSIKELAINGEDLINIGIQKGPQIGKILNELVDMVIESPKSNTKEALIEQARKIRTL